MIELLYLTDSTNSDLIEEERQRISFFSDFGIRPIVKVWNEVDWSEYKNILIRTVWDYTEHSELFIKKVNDATESGSVIIHPKSILDWNIDKSYLVELAKKRLNIVETIISHSLTTCEVKNYINKYSAIVVKPRIGAGGVDTFVIKSLENLPEYMLGRDVLIQPYIESIKTKGEFSYIFFDGEFSHCVLKRPRCGEFRVQDDYGGVVSKYTPSESEIRMAKVFIDNLDFNTIYARVDLVECDNKLLLMELELIEPELFLRFSENGMNCFAKAIKKHLT